MRIPLDWLSEWIALPASVEVLAERLTLGGLEIDDIERSGPDLGALRVGHIVACERHPNADRLSLCRVDLGAGEPLDIVCGASNVAEGQRVAVVSPGTTLPDGTKVKKSKIRGVVSHGMICSDRELGLGDEHEGILVLDPKAEIGAPLDTVIHAGETVLDIAIPPNRGDCASLLGIAREARAHFEGEIVLPPSDPPEGQRSSAEDVRIEIDDPEGCYAYVGRVVRGVRIGPSPEWLRSKIEAAGVRSINVVVDVTNLVLLEYGQPIHAFDLATLGGGVVRVRRASDGERLRTLDDQDRELSANDLVIADAERPIALAGVMGGAETEVTERTQDILIESAHFQPSLIRRTARRLGLQTEASYRFERGVDPEGIRRAADRAARLLAELAGAEVSRDPIETRGATPDRTEEIRLEVARVNRLLGTEIANDEVTAYLARVGVESERVEEGVYRCRIPSHRNDLHRPQDLIEEVSRIFGYDRIGTTLPMGPLRSVELPPSRNLAERARDSLRASGVLEAIVLPFVAAADLDGLRLPPEDPRRRTVELLNPLVEEERLLRPLLVPTLLRLAYQNRSRQVETVRLFEVSHVFERREGELPNEALHLGVILVRGEEPQLWSRRDPPPLFYEAKGIAERFVTDLGRVPTFPSRSAEPFLHPGAACDIAAGDRVIGFLGEIHVDVAAAFDLNAPCAVLEIDLSALGSVPERPRQFREISRHPRAQRDLSVLIDRDRSAGELLEAIRKAGGSSLVGLDIFDRYEGEGIPEGHVSLAFRLVFQRQDRTLTDPEVTKQTDRILTMLGQRFGAKLR
jgi:phenylalanyl-tRNA synthetase beta chain